MRTRSPSSKPTVTACALDRELAAPSLDARNTRIALAARSRTWSHPVEPPPHLTAPQRRARNPHHVGRPDRRTDPASADVRALCPLRLHRQGGEGGDLPPPPEDRARRPPPLRREADPPRSRRRPQV